MLKTVSGSQLIKESALMLTKSTSIQLDIESIPKKWMEDDFLRVFYDVLNTAIPPFERYVIQAMKAVKSDPRLKDETRLLKLIDIFIAQEIEHSKMHHPVKTQLQLDKLKTPRWSHKVTRWIQQKTPVSMSLASAAFIEYIGFGFFKGHIDQGVFYRPELDPEMAKLWKWHVAEEMQHSFVKLKVINHLNPNYKVKFLGMIEALIVCQFFVVVLIPEILWLDAKANNRSFIPHAAKFIKGLAQTDWGITYDRVMSYFAKDFDPEIIDSVLAKQIDQWLQEVAAN